MIHDLSLVHRLAALPTHRFESTVFRATRVSADPVAASVSGGRWAPPSDGDPGTYILYTSLEPDGAIAEIVSFLATLTPVPGARPIKVTRLAVSAARTLSFSRSDLIDLGVDLDRYGERDYTLTQKIGAALAFLELDGFLAPSARWSCDNFMLFTENHSLAENLEVISETTVEWRSWALQHGILFSK